MKIEKTITTKRFHTTVIIDSIAYYRNEESIYYPEKDEWKQEKLTWHVGDKEGKGPYVIPSSELDEFQKHKPEQLEEQFQTLYK